jgi:lambda family phage portal protein
VRKKPTFWQRAKTAVTALRGYAAVNNTRYRGRRGNDPIRSEEIELSGFDRDKLISAALEFRRNNPIVASISRLRKADVVGRGIHPQASTGDSDLDASIDRRWEEYAKDPEITGQMDLRELQQQMVDALLFYGDSGLVFTNRESRVQFVDGSRIANRLGTATASEKSDWQNGVKVDQDGRPTAYLIGNRVYGMVRDQTEVPALNFIPFFRRVRPIQYRGIPELAPILNVLQDLDEYDNIEMISAKVAASLSVAIKREGAYDYEIAARQDDQDDRGNLERFEPGRFHYLNPGEDAQVISSNGRPNVDGIQWVAYLLRKAGSAVGIPLEFLLMEIGKSSFSASQGVVLQYQQMVESYQSDVIRVMEKWYRRWLIAEIAAGRITPSANVDLFHVRWQRPAFRWINRVAQVKADMEYYRLGAMSLDDITAPFGYTAEEVLIRKAQNIEAAKRIAEQHGIQDWQQLINPFNTNLSGTLEEMTNATNDDE